MAARTPELITDKIAGWRPSPEAQQLVVWRVIQLYMARYGSIPTGELLVALSTVTLNELGGAPTVTELCEATGLPKSSISRYVSGNMASGVITEDIDPEDRRRRRLVQTDAGREERRYMVRAMRRILEEVRDWDVERKRTGKPADVAEAVQQMKSVVLDSPEPLRKRRKRGPKRAD